MYISQYFTNPEIDQRLLQGYYDDFVKAGFVGSKAEFMAFVLSIANKVEKEAGKGLSSNDFTNELKTKLEAIDAGAKLITKISQLENDSKYQTDADVKEAIDKLINGASEALDTLKELAEALDGDPNFANTLAAKLAKLATDINEEVVRAKKAELALSKGSTELKTKVEALNTELNNTINTLKAEFVSKLGNVDVKVTANTKEIAEVKQSILKQTSDIKEYVDKAVTLEHDRAVKEEKANTKAINALEVSLISEKAALESKINQEINNRTLEDEAIKTKIQTESDKHKVAEEGLDAGIKKEIEDRKTSEANLKQELVSTISEHISKLDTKLAKETSDREKADTEVKALITVESTERKAADSLLIKAVNDLTLKCNNDKSELQESIRKETEERKSTYYTLLSTKVDKVEGKSLSTNDFTDQYKRKLDELGEGATKVEKLSQLINDVGFLDKAGVNDIVKEVIGSAPEALDTLKELADSIGNDADFAGTVTRKITAVTEQLNLAIEDYKKADLALGEKIELEKAHCKLNLDHITKSLEQEAKLRTEKDEELKSSINSNKAEQSAVNLELRTALENLRNSIFTAHNELIEQIGQNTQGIQNNLRLIQALQSAIGSIKADWLEAVKAEEEARKAADKEIIIRLDSIAGSYQTELEQLQRTLEQKLAKEKEDRTQADANLETNIGDLRGSLQVETSAREAADTQLEQKLAKEKEDRTNQFNALKEKLDASLIELKEADKTTLEKLNTDTSRLENLISVNTAAIVKETEDREKSIQGSIQGLEETIKIDLEDLEKKLKSEISTIKLKVDSITTLSIQEVEQLYNQIY